MFWHALEASGSGGARSATCRPCGLVGFLQSSGAKIGKGVRSWWQRLEFERELSGLSDGEIEDIGFMRSEIPTVVKNYPGSRRLRERMFARLGLDERDAWQNYPRRMRSIHRNCALCGEGKACRNWLDEGGPDRSYRVFCPNAADLDSLRSDQGRKAGATAVGDGAPEARQAQSKAAILAGKPPCWDGARRGNTSRMEADVFRYLLRRDI